MATIDIIEDFLAFSVEAELCKQSPWRLDNRNFAKAERKCIKVHKRPTDGSQESTLHVLENLFALISCSEDSYRFGTFKQWECDFIRHLLGFVTYEEERQFTEACSNVFKLCEDKNSTETYIGKKLTALLRHDSPVKKYMYPNGAVEMGYVFDCCNTKNNPAQQFQFGKQFAAFIQGNNQQRYFVEVQVNNEWFLDGPNKERMPWKIFIGCNQGHSTGIVRPIESSHQLTMVELHCFGWIFHVTDQKFVGSIYENGLKRYSRDTLHFMYDNDGSDGYIRKGVGTKPPRTYDSTRYCILKTQLLLKDGFELFLTPNGVILIYADIPCQYFDIVQTFPYIGFNYASKTMGHTLPPEIKFGTWRKNITFKEQYEEYLPPGEISEYLDYDGGLVEWRIPRDPPPKRRTTAWEFMGQEVPARYLNLLDTMFTDRPGTVPSSSASAEVVGTVASTSSTTAEVVEAEFSTMNNLELQAVQIITENPWHLYRSGIMTLRKNKGERVTNVFGEPVLVVREYYFLATSQQEDLRAQGVTRHVWERYPLAGHAVLFFTRAWELGRLAAYVKNYHSYEDQEVYQHKLKYYENVGWKRDIPDPFIVPAGDNNPQSLERARIEEEEEEDTKDNQELPMFGLFAEAVEDLYTGIIEAYVRKTPALQEEFVMKNADGPMYLVDPDPTAGPPTVPTSENICIDIHNNLKFSPRLCLWAVERKLDEIYQKTVAGTFADFALKELQEYIKGMNEIDQDFYKHLVINTQTRTFEDINYITIGSKVVIRPLAEYAQISMKKDLQLQQTMAQRDPSEFATGDLPSGEMPEANDEEQEAVDSPPGEMAVEEEGIAEVFEDLPPGKRSKTEAKEEEVEMHDEEEPQGEAPQEEEQHDVPMEEAEVEAPDFGDDQLEDDASETNSVQMNRANRLLNSGILDRFADTDDEEEGARRLGPRPRQAGRAMARFMSQFLSQDREFMDEVIDAEEEIRRRRHEEGIPFTEVERNEDVRYGELEERKAQDIFTQASTEDFMAALKPEALEDLPTPQATLEQLLCSGRSTYKRLHTNKMTLLVPLETEYKVKIEIPKPQPTEDPTAVEPDYDCALDKLSQLDKTYKDKNFGFYGKYFRHSHGRSLNFFKYRTNNPVGHPHCHFKFDEEKFMDTYVSLFFSTPTIEDYFHGKPVVYGCEDHRLRVCNSEPQEERSRKARQLFEERQLALRDFVAKSGKDEYSYDDIVSDITELFLSGEKMERNPESLGSSSKSLTTLFWNIGNWKRGENMRLPSVIDPDKIYYKENKPEQFPDHKYENNNLFLQMIKKLRAHIALICEAGTLEPYMDYLKEHNWSFCFNDAKDLCVLARLGKDGSITQIAGPNSENVWTEPNRKINFGIFEICWGKAVPRSTFAASSTGYFNRDEVEEFVDMERARMKVTRVCIYHVDNNAAKYSHGITGEIFAHMLYECTCHQVSIIAGDANMLSYQKANKHANSSYSMSTVQFWTERFEEAMDDYFKKVLNNGKDFNVRQFHSISYADLKFLKDNIEGKVDLPQELRKKTDNMGDCCLMTLFEYGLSTPVAQFEDGQSNDKLEYKYSVNELLFYLTNDILMLRERDKDSHCPILVTIEPSEMTNQEKKSFNTDEQKRQRAFSRKDIQKANKAKGKARAAN